MRLRRNPLVCRDGRVGHTWSSSTWRCLLCGVAANEKTLIWPHNMSARARAEADRDAAPRGLDLRSGHRPRSASGPPVTAPAKPMRSSARPSGMYR